MTLIGVGPRQLVVGKRVAFDLGLILPLKTPFLPAKWGI
jgi:hypothetical protein